MVFWERGGRKKRKKNMRGEMEWENEIKIAEKKELQKSLPIMRVII